MRTVRIRPFVFDLTSCCRCCLMMSNMHLNACRLMAGCDRSQPLTTIKKNNKFVLGINATPAHSPWPCICGTVRAHCCLGISFMQYIYFQFRICSFYFTCAICLCHSRASRARAYSFFSFCLSIMRML